jgi:subtilisin family serine protease
VSSVARALCAAATLACIAAPSATPASSAATRRVVTYRSPVELAALEGPGVRIVRRLPALRSAVVETSSAVGQRPVLRRALTVDEPALEKTFLPGIAWEWQWDAAHMAEVPDDALRSAAAVKIAVIDSGADLGAPDVGDKHPGTWSVLSRSGTVRDVLGHGTFVASLAAGSVTNGVGMSGFGGDAKLLVIKAIGPEGYITDVDEAAAIVYAVHHGARIINLSVGGDGSSAIERRALRWAARHDVLIVAAAGNAHDQGNPVQYPAALLGGKDGAGLAVGATSMDGTRAYFSNTGSYLSLAAPGYNVFAGESASSDWPHAEVPWESPGYYGWASGTSFSAPEVAGVSALVWGVNPRLTARQVAWVLKYSATGNGWNPQLGWGTLNAAAAVELARVTPGKALQRVKRSRRRP